MEEHKSENFENNNNDVVENVDDNNDNDVDNNNDDIVDDNVDEEHKMENVDDDDNEIKETTDADDFIMMTTVRPKCYVLCVDGKPVVTSFDRASVVPKMEEMIRRITVDYSSIGQVYVDSSRENRAVMSLRLSNQVWSTDRIIHNLEIHLVDCI